MKKIYLITTFCALSMAIHAQTYCLTFANPVPENGKFRIGYTLVATVAVDASILIQDGNNNDIEIIPPAPGGLASYAGNFLSPTSTLNVIDLGVSASSNGATVTAFCALLPIELVKFQAKAGLEGNLLTWQSANEINSSHFDIEKSADGITFEKIGEVKAQGKAANYDYLDKATFGGWGLLYYRLKINDLDSQFDYSNIVSLASRQKGFTIKAYPNPFTDHLTVDISTEKKSSLTIELIDILGRQIYHSNVKDTEGVLSMPITIKNLPNGTYLIKIFDGQQAIQQKIIKH